MPKKCPRVECGKNKCCQVLRKISIPAALGDDSKDSEVAPKNGAYRNALVEYEANGALYIYSSEGIYTLIGITKGASATVEYVNEGDIATLSSAKLYTNNIGGSVIDEAKEYSDTKDAETLAAAKAYTDSHSGGGGTDRAYVDQQDAATLQNAKNYADQQVNILRSTVTGEINQAGANTLQSAKGYTDQQVAQTFANAPVITMTDTDPGEGQPLEANHFIAVYQGGE